MQSAVVSDPSMESHDQYALMHLHLCFQARKSGELQSAPTPDCKVLTQDIPFCIRHVLAALKLSWLKQQHNCGT